LIPQRQAWSGGRLQLDCVKMFLDGVPLEGRTAVMLEPYEHRGGAHDDQGPGGGQGLKLIPEDKLFPAVTAFDRQGIQVKFHAAGDGAVREAVEAIAAARRSQWRYGATAPRDRPQHLHRRGRRAARPRTPLRVGALALHLVAHADYLG
jgi:predicted amidohydrolase YtcJ